MGKEIICIAIQNRRKIPDATTAAIRASLRLVAVVFDFAEGITG